MPVVPYKKTKQIVPYYKSECGRVVVYKGNCLDVLPTLQAGSVDALITDPPYGIGFKYNEHDDSSEGYGQWMWSVIEMAESKCSPGSPVFVWQAMLNIRNLTEWFPREWRLFAAAKNFVQMRPSVMQYAFDPVVVWWTDGEAWALGTSSRDFHVANTANTHNRGNGDSCGHPCARPLDQVVHIVKQWVRPNGLLLDPFMGSGTAGVACIREGRRFIGIEIDEKYCDISVGRLRHEISLHSHVKPVPIPVKVLKVGSKK